MQHASAETFVVPAVREAPRHWVRAHARLLAVLTVVLCLAVVAILQCLAARSHLERGAQEARDAIAVLHDPLRLRQSHHRVLLRATLTRAHDDFGAARADLFLWTPLLDHLGWMPTYGPELTSASRAADISYRSADAALLLLNGLEPVFQTMQDRRAAGSRLPRLAVALGEKEAAFVRANADMERAMLDLHGLPPSLGNAGLDAMLRRLRVDVPRLQAATSWLVLAPQLLGDGHPATYLVVWQDPAELRATGGFIGASDLVTMDQGHISHRFYGHQLPHNITWPPPPVPEEMYTPETTWLFQDSNWSPDFPLTARFERWFYGEDTGHWPDSVIDFLDTATPDLLRATGPVYLAQYHLWVNAGNVSAQAQAIVNGRYRSLQGSGVQDTVRKQFFLLVLKALLGRIEHLPLDRLPAVGKALEDMIQRRELLMYSRQPGIDASIRRAGADGQLSPGRADYLFVVDDNRSYNKLNPYVHETASYAVTVTRTLALEAALTLHYHVASSPPDLEGGGPNWGLWGTVHDYQDFLRVYVPLGAKLESISGLDPWAPQIAYGATQFAGRLLLRAGKSDTVVIHYRIPANVFSATGRRQYHLRVQHQPGADLRSLSIVVRAGGGVLLPHGNSTYAITLPLTTDAHLHLGIRGRLAPRLISLPRLPSQTDPYLPFRDLHAPHGSPGQP